MVRHCERHWRRDSYRLGIVESANVTTDLAAKKTCMRAGVESRRRNAEMVQGGLVCTEAKDTG